MIRPRSMSKRVGIPALLATILFAGPARAEACTTDDVKEIIRQVWPDDLEEAAIRVAWCESRHKPDAANSKGYRGLFQLGRQEWKKYGAGGDVFDAHDNAHAALRLYQDRHHPPWQPWVCKP